MAADKELEIHLKTTADTAGIQATQEALKTTTAAQTDSEKMVAALEEKRNQARRESEAQSSAWIAEWKQQSVAAREAEIEAIKRVEEEAGRAATAAEEAAKAGVQGVNLQKAAQLKELASQAREIGATMKAAMDATADGSKSAVEQFDAVAQAGTTAASGIAAGFMAFGPTGAVVVAVLAGLRLVAEMMEEDRKKAEKALADQLKAAKETAEGIRKALGEDEGFDYSSSRTTVEENRKKALAEIERKADRAKKDASTTRTVGDLEDEGPDGYEKERRKAERDATERDAKAKADKEALAARMKVEKETADRLDLERKTLEQERDDKSIALKGSDLGSRSDPESRAEVKRQTDEIAAIKKELDRVKQDLKSAQSRQADLQNEGADAGIDRDAADKIGTLRGNKSVDAAMQREAEKNASEAEARRQRNQAAMDDMNKKRGGVMASTAKDFADENKGFGEGREGKQNDSKLAKLAKAADALKDGATQQELDAFEQALNALADTILAKEKGTQQQLSRMWKMMEKTRTDLDGSEARARKEREN